MPAFTPERVLILGIGNVLWADEGFGVRCVETLATRVALPDHVRLLDGGTQGLYLLPFLEEADAMLVFDAIDFGLAPGTLKVLRDAGEIDPARAGRRALADRAPSSTRLVQSTNPLEVMEMRLMIEPALARLAALRASPDEIARILQTSQ